MNASIRIALLAITLWACQGKPSVENKTAPEKVVPNEITLTDAQVKQSGITIGNPGSREIREDITVHGVVDVPPQNMVSVSFPMGGFLRSTKLLPGMYVRKGEVIGLMEEQSLVQLQQDYLVTKAKLEYQEKEYQRQQELNVDKVNADKTLQLAAAEYQSLKVMLRGYAEKLRLIGIAPEHLTETSISRQVPLYAPTSGFVSRVNVNVGKFVQPTDVLFELVNPDDIHAALTIYEKDLGRVKIGQKVRISFVDEPEKIYQGEVILVNRNVDENRAAIAHCHFLTKPGQLLPGMFLNARIEAGASQGIALPESAVVAYQGKHYAFLELGKNRFQMQEVRIGNQEGGYVSIPDGANLFKDKQVVLSNAYSLLGAMKNAAEE